MWRPSILTLSPDRTRLSTLEVVQLKPDNAWCESSHMFSRYTYLLKIVKDFRNSAYTNRFL